MISLKYLGNIHLTEKSLKCLNQNRITTILDFLQEEPEKLSTITKLNLPEVISIRQDIFNKFSAQLINANTLLPDLLSRKKFVSTGIKSLDTVLGGGMFTGYVTEVCGLAESGKSQLSMQIAINSTINNGTTVLYIDTKGDFSSIRVQKCLENYGCSHKEMAVIMSKIKVIKVWKMDELNEVLKKIKNKSLMFNNLSLIIIDSMPALMFQHLGDKSKIGLKHFNTFVNYSRYLSKELNIAFICVNIQTRWIEQDTPEFEDNEETNIEDNKDPMLVEKRTRCLGKYWQNIPTVIVIVEKCPENPEVNGIAIKCTILKTCDPTYKKHCNIELKNSVIT